MKNITLKLFLFIFILGFQQAVAQDNTALVKEFDAYIEKAKAEWQVPGLSVAVVKDGKVLLSKGYGVRELGKQDLVNGQTLFACASTTKAMTAACMAILVDEGKIKWDDLVITYLPEFQLYDEFVTRELRIRDLFTHNSGVGNADFLWTQMNISSAEVLNKMRLVRPSYSLRSGFIYQNIFYIAAGAVIEKVSGQSWDSFMKTRLFQPLKMNRTFPKLKEVKDINQSSPHFTIENRITVIERTNADEIGSAGSVWSCADDMAKWAIAMLDSSKYEGGRLLKASTWTELFKPQVIAPASFYPTTKLTKPNWTTYAFGWYQQDYQGRKTNYHTGSLAGEVAIHGQLPSERLAIYVFGNLDHAEVRHALLFKAFDHFALGGTTDWSTEFKALYKTADEQTEKREKDFESKRIMGTAPSHPLSAYSGKYTDPLFGELEVVANGTSLNLVVNNKNKATLMHWHYDTFRGWYDKKWYGKGNAVFSADATGKITRVTIAGMEFRR